MTDLSLVAIDDLYDEMEKRCENLIVITSRYEDPEAPMIRVRYSGGAAGAIGLTEIGKNYLIGRDLEDEY
jgi:hypothetical protein